MRAVIYARFSTELQSVASIEDQARLCRERATALGLTVVAVHSDCAVSGATPVDRRPGASACVADALAGRFDVLLIESLDRLSRNLVEQETVIRRLEHRGVRIIGVSDGYDSTSGAGRKLLRGVRGLISETYLDDLRAKTHRGLTGQIERGYHAGGLSYGYRSVVAGVNARGEPIGHRLEIDASAGRDRARDLRALWRGRVLPAHRRGSQRAWRPRPAGRDLVRVGALRLAGEGRRRAEQRALCRPVRLEPLAVDQESRHRKARAIHPAGEPNGSRSSARSCASSMTSRGSAVRERMASPRRAGGRKGRGGVPTTLLGGILRCGHCGGSVVKVNARDVRMRGAQGSRSSGMRRCGREPCATSIASCSNTCAAR